MIKWVWGANKIIKLGNSWLTITLICLLIVSTIMTSSCTTSSTDTELGNIDANEPLAVNIYSPEDGACFNVNVQKAVGAVSYPEATVLINGTEAKVSQDGSFYAYIDL